MIPRIIHYCWFGGNEKPEIVTQCIASWRKYCPDWEIKEWNESNFDVNVMPFMKEAYEAKKWAFVSDVARLMVILERGGVYLDTDVELLGSIDSLHQADAFFVFESNRNINTGIGFGAEADHPAVRAMLGSYEGKRFINKGKMDVSPCPDKNTEALCQSFPQFRRNGLSQSFMGMQVFSRDEYSKIAIHHEAKSWVEGFVPKKHVFRDSYIKRFLRRPEHFEMIEKCFGKKAVKIYTFISYDLLEMGPIYYCRRIINRIARKLKRELD